MSVPGRILVAGASSGLGRCIAVGLAGRGASVALLARRAHRLQTAAEEAGPSAVAVPCDVRDEQACVDAVAAVVDRLGGLDALVYAAGMSPLARLADTDGDQWRAVFDVNVVGAAQLTRAALPALAEAGGRAAYLSSVAASVTGPWPGLGAYASSKAALDTMVEAWRGEHPEIGFSRIVVGDCAGGEGDGATGFADGWDPALLGELYAEWVARGLRGDGYVDVAEVVDVVAGVLAADAPVRSVTVAPARRELLDR